MELKMENLTLTLTPAQFNVIMAALDEIPHKHARPVIDELVKQAQAQQIVIPETPAE